MKTDKLNELLTRFAAEIETLVRDDVTASVLAALSGKAFASPGAKSKAPGAGASSGKGVKRSPADLELLTKRLHGYVSKNPGQRIELIAAGMGVSTKQLNLPVKKLIAQKLLKTKGQKRATAYSAR